jgi:lipopolysaccharide/colanic/teichoic acid biosynthesis glycosyltransferase
MTVDHDVQITSRENDQGAAADGGIIEIHPLKATFDKMGTLLVIVVLSPLLLLIALAIKFNGLLHPEDRGPVIYKETRVSQGRIFDLYKFRVLKTAVIEAAWHEKGYHHAKPLERCEDSQTRVGRWLQRWYLDEVPQVFNILKGDMSLVGPRPWPVSQYREELARGIYRKQLLRPGLTGLVQVHKDELGAMGGDRALDETYIEACRTLGPVQLLLFDLRVIADTFMILAKGQGL